MLRGNIYTYKLSSDAHHLWPHQGSSDKSYLSPEKPDRPLIRMYQGQVGTQLPKDTHSPRVTISGSTAIFCTWREPERAGDTGQILKISETWSLKCKSGRDEHYNVACLRLGWLVPAMSAHELWVSAGPEQWLEPAYPPPLQSRVSRRALSRHRHWLALASWSRHFIARMPPSFLPHSPFEYRVAELYLKIIIIIIKTPTVLW